LVAHALFEVAVGADREHVVVTNVLAEALAEVPLDDADAYPVAEALSEWAGRDLDAGGVAAFRVTGRARPELAELFEVVGLEGVPGEGQHRVKEHGCVPGRQDEAVTVGPIGVGGVVPQDACEEHVRQRCKRHGGAGMAGVGPLDRVHRQSADHVDGAPLELLGYRRRLRNRFRRHAPPSISAYADSRTRSRTPGGRHANNARLAVKPCRKLRPPTGPISPAQNAPASGIGPSSPPRTPAPL